LMSILGVSPYGSRFLPLVCGLTALFLFARLARQILPRRPALVALVLFAFSNDLIYYSSELKPYSTDLAIGLAVSLLAVEALDKRISLRRAVTLSALAVAVPWFSFGSAFVIAGSGATLILTYILSRRLRDAAVWSAIGITWLVSFLISYRASMAIVLPYDAMYRFWHFAFLPVWPLPLDRGRLADTAGLLLEIFVNPLNLVAPLWPRVGVIFPIALLFVGGVSLARRSWPDWTILVLPIALAMVASAMKRYPFHGRLILELVPAFFLLIALGTETLRGWDRSRTRLGYRLVLILLLTYPCLVAFQNAASEPIREFNSHGDLRRNIFIK
jgi:Dolichyl-phosphate-mannose-protein mannosyltransferase